MNINWKTYNINGTKLEAKVTSYDPGDKKLLGKLYIKWRDLNAEIKKTSTRGINLPEAISENAFCIFFTDCQRVVKLRKGKCSFDAINTVTGEKIQIKASSIENDLSSFGPRSEWDELYFLDFSKADGTFDVYKIDADLIYGHQVSATQSFSDQQKEKRRPRFSIKKDIIIPRGIKPLKICSLV